MQPPQLARHLNQLHRRDVLRGKPGLVRPGPGRNVARPGAGRHGGRGGAAASTFGRAKSCILLFMWGGPAHQDTWDLKPRRAGRDSRRVLAHRDQGAGHSDLRTLSAVGDAHRPAGHRALDDPWRRGPHHRHALPADRAAAAEDARAARRLAAHWRRAVAPGARRDPLPPFVSLRPKLENDVPRFVEQTHGQSAGWLGQAFDPLSIDANPAGDDYRVGDFRLPPEISVARLDARRALLGDINAQIARPGQARGADGHGPARASGV